jgi:hypothetical protein
VTSSGGTTPDISLVNNAGTPAEITAIDIGTIANSDTVIPTSKAVYTGLGLLVPKTTTITATTPLLIDNTTSADLSANRTLSIPAASSGVNGYMTGTYATKLDGIATGATAGGLFDIDLSGDLEPTTGIATDEYYELDVNDDITPKAA